MFNSHRDHVEKDEYKNGNFKSEKEKTNISVYSSIILRYVSQESMKELYERNKNIFFTELKSIRYAEIKPELISGSKEFDENFAIKKDPFTDSKGNAENPRKE